MYNPAEYYVKLVSEPSKTVFPSIASTSKNMDLPSVRKRNVLMTEYALKLSKPVNIYMIICIWLFNLILIKYINLTCCNFITEHYGRFSQKL